MAFLRRLWVRFLTSEQLRCGQGLMEYALLIVLVGVLLIISVVLLGTEVRGLYEYIVEHMPIFD